MVSKIRSLTKKQIAITVAAASVIGVVGATSVTQAAPVGKPTKEQCQQAGFSNYGQCVRVWGQGHGYSGSGTREHTVTETRSISEVTKWTVNWHFW